MSHDYEQLGDRRFQMFCQALLVAEFPELSCLPVGMPDGGRDAVVARSSATDGPRLLIFQVKYVERPAYLQDATAWAEEVIQTELEKIRVLVDRGSAEKYILLTNVPATSHLGVGSHDKVQDVMDRLLPIAGQCLWRGDLDRRLENRWDLKWSYPDLMKGVDLIRALVEGRLSEHATRRARAMRAFLADQYANDREVRFKQADLQNDLINVFIDVAAEPQRQRPEAGVTELQARIFTLARADEDYRDPYLLQRFAYGAGSLLLDADVQNRSPKMVIEGAPGQGKSTLAQYVCQVHRIRLLGGHDDLCRLPPEHRTGPLRLPLKLDLRELAQWLDGVSPFGHEAEPPAEDQRSLEGFWLPLSGGAPAAPTLASLTFKLCWRQGPRSSFLMRSMRSWTSETAVRSCRR